jgi:hypothetical protein
MTPGSQSSFDRAETDSSTLLVVAHPLPEGGNGGLLGRISEIVELFVERVHLRAKFTVLRLEVDYLHAERVYLRKRERTLRFRLVAALAARGIHARLH